MRLTTPLPRQNIAPKTLKNGSPSNMHDKTANFPPPPAIVKREASAVPRALRRYLSLDDFEATARRRLPKMLYG